MLLETAQNQTWRGSDSDMTTFSLPLLPSSAAFKAEEGVKMGWGACSVSGCPCREYQKAYGSELCGNCGHQYSQHW